jgi:hypothetical protein
MVEFFKMRFLFLLHLNNANSIDKSSINASKHENFICHCKKGKSFIELNPITEKRQKLGRSYY